MGAITNRVGRAEQRIAHIPEPIDIRYKKQTGKLSESTSKEFAEIAEALNLTKKYHEDEAEARRDPATTKNHDADEHDAMAKQLEILISVTIPKSLQSGREAALKELQEKICKPYRDGKTERDTLLRLAINTKQACDHELTNVLKGIGSEKTVGGLADYSREIVATYYGRSTSATADKLRTRVAHRIGEKVPFIRNLDNLAGRMTDKTNEMTKEDGDGVAKAFANAQRLLVKSQLLDEFIKTVNKRDGSIPEAVAALGGMREVSSNLGIQHFSNESYRIASPPNQLSDLVLGGIEGPLVEYYQRDARALINALKPSALAGDDLAAVKLKLHSLSLQNMILHEEVRHLIEAHGNELDSSTAGKLYGMLNAVNQSFDALKTLEIDGKKYPITTSTSAELSPEDRQAINKAVLSKRDADDIAMEVYGILEQRVKNNLNRYFDGDKEAREEFIRRLAESHRDFEDLAGQARDTVPFEETAPPEGATSATIS